jgi:hypothetical protein
MAPRGQILTSMRKTGEQTDCLTYPDFLQSYRARYDPKVDIAVSSWVWKRPVDALNIIPDLGDLTGACHGRD